jgi:PDZ domain-containing protein
VVWVNLHSLVTYAGHVVVKPTWKRIQAALWLWLAIVVVAMFAWATFGSSGEVALVPSGVFPVSTTVKVAGQPKTARGVIYSASVAAKPLSPLSYVVDHLDSNLDFYPAIFGRAKEAPQALGEREQETVVAAEAAARCLRFPVMSIPGVVVHAVLRNSPAYGRLFPGDLIVEVNGQRVTNQAAIDAAIAQGVGSNRITLGVLRFDSNGAVVGGLKRFELPYDGGRLGLILGSGLYYRLPFQVSSRVADSRLGYSALAEALSIVEGIRGVDKNAPRVAAIGGLAPSGQVLPVFGIRQRVIAARNAGIDLVLVPRSQVEDAEAASLGKVKVIGVRNLQGAVTALRLAKFTGQHEVAR